MALRRWRGGDGGKKRELEKKEKDRISDHPFATGLTKQGVIVYGNLTTF